MKNRLKLYFASERKPNHKPPNVSRSNLRQFKLITLYGALAREMGDADVSRQGHYGQVLLSLRQLIESFGPSPDYKQWVNSISSPCPIQFPRRSR